MAAYAMIGQRAAVGVSRRCEGLEATLLTSTSLSTAASVVAVFVNRGLEATGDEAAQRRAWNSLLGVVR